MNSKKRPSPADYEERDRCILRFMDRYGGVAFGPVISKKLINGKEAGHVLRRLGEEKNLGDLHSKKLPGNYSYLTLNKRGYREIGKDVAKVEVSGPKVSKYIGLSVYCTFEDPGAELLTRDELDGMFGHQVPLNEPHIILTEFAEDEAPTVLRVYYAKSDLSKAKKKVRELFKKWSVSPGLEEAVKYERYGLLALVPTIDKAKQLERVFEKAQLFNLGCLQVGVAPTADTLRSYLKRQGENRG